ncbi:MAG TPA: tetraacyldisaccharide 4'-kinase [Spongiibacteraceae bacterium]|nr:tetraacyldisaccharide 4'-kinase [Spongiibacteraceae bacterium]HCS28671.1 tetraacyldisaccharide 4'-kinase [Spongiibacteraceae bacterium]
MSSLHQRIERAWYRRNPGILYLAWPLEAFYRSVSTLRRLWLKKRAIPQLTPVIVVGNISVGGTGKTPLVIALVHWLQAQGYKPGVVSRGYGGQASHYPFTVTRNSSADDAGDEPLLIAREAGCPVVVGPDRVAALGKLERDFACNIVVSDDGLQHYALKRDIEIVVVDGARGLGNGHCLPVGPLREPGWRLNTADILVVNGEAEHEFGRSAHTMLLEPRRLVNIKTGEKMAVSELPPAVHAVAGIGNPRRFFTTLIELGLRPITHSFVDHHQYTAEDIEFGDSLPVIMTEKDAVKCAGFASDKHWYLPVTAALPAAFFMALESKINLLNEEDR